MEYSDFILSSFNLIKKEFMKSLNFELIMHVMSAPVICITKIEVI